MTSTSPARRHLFLDPQILQRAERATLCVNPPRTQQIVLRRDQPWEKAMMNLFLTIREENGLLRMWYSSESVDPRPHSEYAHRPNHVCYAESRDGVNWEKPELGLVEFEGSKANNIIGLPNHEGSVCYDPTGSPEARYVCVTHLFKEGMVRFFSPDGLHWQRDAQPLLAFRCDTQNVTFWDAQHGCYVLYLRGWDVTPGWNDRLRRVARLTLATLSQPTGIVSLGHGRNPEKADDMPRIVDEVPSVFAADEQDPPETDVYNMAGQTYPLDPRWYLAFPAMFRRAPGGCRVNDGRLEVHCIGSSDGIQWQRYNRQAYVTPGLAGSENCDMLFMGTGMVIRGDEIWQYGTGYRTRHGQPQTRRQQGDGVIYRYVQRLDGFVSLDFSSQGGRAVTVPVEVEGPCLFVNVDTGALGELRVAIRDETGAPIPGFTIEDCAAIQVNATRTQVKWKDNSDFSNLVGKKVQLEFRGARTKLYAFYFDCQQ